MNGSWFGIKAAAIAGAAIFLLLGGAPAQAQVPGGSYLRTCTNVHGSGDRIFAVCRREDGSWRRTALGGIGSCGGDISNQNGHLACNHGGYGSSYRGYPYRRDYYYGR